MHPKLVIFDLDGTLVNTIEDVADCFNAALFENGFPTYSLEKVEELIGGDLETIVGRMLPEVSRSRENIDRVKTDYRRIYAESPKSKTVPYEGIPQLLNDLEAAGVGIAVNTNKSQDLAEDCIAELFPGKNIPVAGYVDDMPSKPNPQGARRLLELFEVSEMDAVYVGDGISDARTAKNANVPFVFCSWGQGKEGAASKVCPNMLIAGNVNRLHEILFGGGSHE